MNINIKIAGLCIAFSVLLFSCKNDKKDGGTTTSVAVKTEDGKGLKLAYVNGDTLNANYIFLKEKKESYEKKQAAFENEMSQKQKQLQNEYVAFQKKAQSGAVTQAEGEAAQKRLAQQQQALEQRHQSISAQLMKEQEAIQSEFQKRLDNFLEKYNKEKGFDFIFTYSKVGGQILYANKALDITKEVLEKMNAESSKPTTSSESTTPSAAKMLGDSTK